MNETYTIALGLFTAASSFIAAVASFVGILRKSKLDDLSKQLEQTKKTGMQTKQELLKVYRNVGELLSIERDLSAELDVGKITVRKGYQTDEYIQPKRVRKRILELSEELKSCNK